ncbi:TetR/AcrR family transcriptional regulator [Deinococcus oregonensis]|uniref:TetR/AcrR family transcriptional regulator n=1 Tax=Deinococcus oregonensis TaxID=1805970 RepID=A0ABV6AYS1_9DEIO
MHNKQTNERRGDASVDLRVRRTRKHLKEALMELTREKGYAAVTVGDLTARAMVNRATFYRHYEDKYDLVVDCLQDLLEDVPPMDLGEALGMTSGEAPPTVVRFFEHVGRHAEFYCAMLRQGGMPSFGEHLRTLVEREVEREIAASLERLGHGHTLTIPPGLLPNFVADAVVGMTVWWFEQERGPSAQEVARWFVALVLPGVRASLERAEPHG